MMKAGRVVQIRVNPRDCMAVVDLVDKLGIYIPGMSFAQAVSAALACGMETFRSKNILPVRDGFEFSQLMGKYPEAKGRRQLDISKQFEMAGSEIRVPIPNESVATESLTIDQSDRIWRKLRELQFKRDADPENWSKEEQAEYDRLIKQV